MIKTIETQYYCTACEYIGYEVFDAPVYHCPKCHEVLDFNTVGYIIECINNSRCGGDYEDICDDNQVSWHCICREHTFENGQPMNVGYV